MGASATVVSRQTPLYRGVRCQRSSPSSRTALLMRMPGITSGLNPASSKSFSSQRSGGDQRVVGAEQHAVLEQ